MTQTFRLVKIASSSDIFEDRFTNKCVGLVDLVDLYPSMQIPLDILIHKCDTIMPRYYTIASSALVSPTQVRIAISLSTFNTPSEQNRKGLVSLWCQRLQKDASLETRLFTKDSFFVLQDKPSLMIGPGTGVVPFIAFAEER